MVPHSGVSVFSLIPIWYLRSTAASYKKHLNEELETAISIITTSYLRTEDLIRSVKENLPYINEPVKANFEAFVYEAELINANITSAINSLKMKIPNRVFHEWCGTLIQCQSDRSMKNTLPTINQKFSDVRVVQSELEAMMQGPRREAITMIFLVIANVPLLYFLNEDWFHTLIFTTPGKIAQNRHREPPKRFPCALSANRSARRYSMPYRFIIPLARGMVNCFAWCYAAFPVL